MRPGHRITMRGGDAMRHDAHATRQSTLPLAVEQSRWGISGMRLVLEERRIEAKQYIGRVVVQLTNCGWTAAEITHTVLRCRTLRPLDEVPRYPLEAIASVTDFGKHVVPGADFVFSLELTLADEEAEQLRLSEKHLWLVGYVVYRDSLGGHWQRSFGGALQVQSMTWDPLSEDPSGRFEPVTQVEWVGPYRNTRYDDWREVKANPWPETC